MTIRLDGKVALVTGAGAGLGRAHARLLAARGARVVVNDPAGSVDGISGGDAPADRVVAEIRAEGGEAVANYASVADRSGAASTVETALEQFGAIHIVVNNAGILRDKTFSKMTLDEFELVLAVHLLGTVYVTKAAWPHLVAQNWGRVIFTSSGSGPQESPHFLGDSKKLKFSLSQRQDGESSARGELCARRRSDLISFRNS